MKRDPLTDYRVYLTLDRDKGVVDVEAHDLRPLVEQEEEKEQIKNEPEEIILHIKKSK